MSGVVVRKLFDLHKNKGSIFVASKFYEQEDCKGHMGI